MDQHVRLPAPVQPGGRHGLLAHPQGRQQKTHRGHLRRLCAGAHFEQRLLRPQLQLLCPVVLYAGADLSRHDGVCAGRPGGGCKGAGFHRPGRERADAGNAGLCRGPRAGHHYQGVELRCFAEPRPVRRRAGLWPCWPAGVSPDLQALEGPPGLCPAAAGGGAGLCLPVQRGAHRHRQIRPVVHRQRSSGGVHQRTEAEREPARRRLADRHLPDPRQPRPLAG